MPYNQITFTSEPFIIRSRFSQSTVGEQTLIGIDDENKNRRIYGMTVNSTQDTQRTIWVSGSFSGGDYVPLFSANIPSYSGYINPDVGNTPISAFDLFASDNARIIFQTKRDSNGNYYFDLPGDSKLVANLTTELDDNLISILTFGEK